MAVPQYCDEVLVTLSSHNPPSSFAFPDRRIFLTKENPIMDIGRTSKRNSSLEATKNNAWFDSAVMSREHAQVRLDAAEQKVYIKDTGSLHGTFQNGVRLPANLSSSLNSGDILRFGISIDRGSDKYPPCIMEARTQFGTASPEDRPKVFRVPDDTDVEYSSSDDDQSIRNSSRIARKIVIKPWSKRKSGSPTRSPIDLTASEQYPISSVRDDQDHAVSALPPVSSTVNLPAEVKCVDLTSQSDDDDYERNGFSPISLRAHWLLGLDGQADDAKSSASQEMDLMGSSDDESHSPSPSPSSSPSPSPSPSPSLCSSPNPAEDSANSLERDHIMGSVEAGEIEEEQYDEVDLEELDEFENGENVCEPSHQPLTPIIPDCPSQSYNPRPLPFTIGTQPEASLAHLLGPGATNCLKSHLPPMESNDVRLPAFTLNNTASQSFVKLPSLTEATSHHRYTPPQVPAFKNLVELLGKKTGKFDYFSAREENKMNASSSHSRPKDHSVQAKPINQEASLDQSTQTNQGSSHSAEHDPNAPSLETFSSNLEQFDAEVAEQMDVSVQTRTDTTEGGLSHTCLIPAKWPSSLGLSESSTSAQSQEPSSGRPSAYDAASAYEFEQMCLEAEEEPRPEAHARQTHKSYQHSAERQVSNIVQAAAPTEAAGAVEQEALGSNTRVDGSEPPSQSCDTSAPTQRSPKRKADAISQLTPAEARSNKIPARISPAQLLPRHTAKPKRHVTDGILGSSSQYTLAVSEPPTARPAKRLRRVAEVFGYAALGGVAVMSALIATAPTL